MKVILQQDVKKLGNKGDVIDVAEGYGRNYLLPRGLAVEATKGNMRQIEKLKQVAAKKTDRERSAAQAIADKIEGKTVEVKAKVGESGKLFGSITVQEIADQMRQTFSVEIDRRKIDLKEPIKSLGSYSVLVRIHPDVHANFTVKVVSA